MRAIKECDDLVTFQLGKGNQKESKEKKQEMKVAFEHLPKHMPLEYAFSYLAHQTDR